MRQLMLWLADWIIGRREPDRVIGDHYLERWYVVPRNPVLNIYLHRSWGFWCPQGWRHWRDFVDPNNPGQRGPGCD